MHVVMTVSGGGGCGLGVVFRKMGLERKRPKSMRFDLHLWVKMETETRVPCYRKQGQKVLL